MKKNIKTYFFIVLLLLAMLPIGSFHAIADMPVTQFVGYQTTDVGEDGAFDLRLVAVLKDADYTQYDSLGFDVTVTFDDATEIKAQTMTRTTQIIYRSIIGGEYTYSSAEFQGEYFFALNCKGFYPELGTLHFSVTTFSIKDGVRTDDSTVTFSYTKDATTAGVLVPTITSGTASALYKIGNGGYEYSYTNVNPNIYSSYLSKLETNGFVKYTENNIDGNLFATYTQKHMQVNVAYYPNIATIKLIWGPRGYLPSLTAPVAGEDYTVVCSPSVTQIYREGASDTSPGECYVVQLEDGSFVVIDGGPKNANDQAALLQYLQSHTPHTHAKPQVTWMITHVDSDHITLANAFIEAYHNLIDINTVCYNFPDFSNTDVFSSESAISSAEGRNERAATFEGQIDTYYPNANRLIFHSGQILYLPGCKIDFLMTHEDYYPNAFSSGNHTCSAWKMSFTDGGSFMVLGDCEKGLCEQMSTVYGDTLRSDVLQVSHHGLNGATLALYQEIDPKICFWPIDEYRFENDGRCLGLYATSDDDGYSYTVYADPDNKTVWNSYNFNYWLRFEDTEWNRGIDNGTRVHYHSGQTVTIDMKTLSRRMVSVSETSFNGFDSAVENEMIWDWSVK